MKTLILFVSVLILLIPASAEKVFWKHPPRSVQLSNGLRLIYQFDDSSATTVFHILIKGGARAQPLEKKGLAFLTTRLMLEVPDRYVFQDLMRITPKYSMLGKMDYSRINFSCLSEHLEEAVGIISSIVQDPVFSSTRISKVKEEMKYRRMGEEDISVIVAHRALMDKFLGDNGFGDAVLGTDESRKSLKRKDILWFYDQFVITGNVLMVVSTDLPLDTIQRWIETYFNEIPAGPAPKTGSLEFHIPESKEVHIEKQSVQTLIALGYSLPELTAQNFAIAFLIDILLGKGVDSRLWALRSEKNLCYNMNSRVTYLKDGGLLEAYLETDSERQEKALTALKEIFVDLSLHGLDPDEFESTKTYAKSYLMRGMETKELRVQNMGYFEISGIGHHIFDEISAVNLDEFNAFLRQFLKEEQAVLVTVGPTTDKEQ